MKTSNKFRKMSVCLIALTLIGISCKDDFLEVAPTGSLVNEQLTTKAGVEAALISAYAALNGSFGGQLEAPNFWVWGSIVGGDANKGTDPGDFSSINAIQRFEMNATDGDLNNLWRGKYEGINRCNLVLNLLAQASTTEILPEDVKRISGEARMLRGHFYFDLKKLFNSIPYFDETVPATEVGTIPNTPDIWGHIEDDFQYAYDNLPATQEQAGRVNKWAAAAYMGKAMLFQHKYAEAKTWFDDVITNGVTTTGLKYGLNRSYADIYNAENDNNLEVVMDVESANNTGAADGNANYFDNLNYPYNTGLDGPGNCCGFFAPSFDLANSFRVGADGLPLLDGSYNDPSNELKTDLGVESSAAFTPDAGLLDPRLDHSIGRRGIPYLDWIAHPGKDWIRSQVYSGPYSTKKYVYYKSQENTFTDGSSWTRGYAIMNYTIIRFADVLLMAAEAEIEAGSLPKAMEYVNMVRARAANSDTWVKNPDGSDAANYKIEPYTATQFASKASATTAVRMERKLELSSEGVRFFDLVRWGIADSVLNAYLQHEGKTLVTMFGGAKFTPDKNEYYPIPQAQIDIEGPDILTQNPGY